MPGMFYIICPRCQEEFYAHRDLEGLDIDMFCPWCKQYFRQGEGRIKRFSTYTSHAEAPASARSRESGRSMG